MLIVEGVMVPKVIFQREAPVMTIKAGFCGYLFAVLWALSHNSDVERKKIDENVFTTVRIKSLPVGGLSFTALYTFSFLVLFLIALTPHLVRFSCMIMV